MDKTSFENWVRVKEALKNQEVLTIFITEEHVL